jgi:A/G-specific adenine glycosylase
VTGPVGADADGAVERLVGWFAREGADLPWRRTRDRYRVLVAEAQLQATPVARVVPYY